VRPSLPLWEETYKATMVTEDHPLLAKKNNTADVDW
jgi:hypothetical protein